VFNKQNVRGTHELHPEWKEMAKKTLKGADPAKKLTWSTAEVIFHSHICKMFMFMFYIYVHICFIYMYVFTYMYIFFIMLHVTL